MTGGFWPASKHWKKTPTIRWPTTNWPTTWRPARRQKSATGRKPSSTPSACELTSWKEAEYLDTLAACHAENGDFAEAIRWSQTAIELATDAEVAEYYTSALKLYQENKPYRDQIEAAPEK